MYKRNILIIASNSSLSEIAVNRFVSDANNYVGLHYSTLNNRIGNYSSQSNVCLIEKSISSEDDCKFIVEQYLKHSNGKIDGLIIMLGGCNYSCDWQDLTVDIMQKEYYLNAILPFMCAKYGSRYMKETGGNIVFIGTASAIRGGGRNTLGYGMSKYALECCVRRLAKDLASDQIAVNAIAPGFIDTESHHKNKTEEEIKNRISFIPMDKAGTTQDFADMLVHIINTNSFMTGQIIALDGGDFL